MKWWVECSGKKSSQGLFSWIFHCGEEIRYLNNRKFHKQKHGSKSIKYTNCNIVIKTNTTQHSCPLLLLYRCSHICDCDCVISYCTFYSCFITFLFQTSITTYGCTRWHLWRMLQSRNRQWWARSALPDGMSDVSDEEAQNLMDQCISGDVFSDSEEEDEEESRKQ